MPVTSKKSFKKKSKRKVGSHSHYRRKIRGGDSTLKQKLKILSQDVKSSYDKMKAALKDKKLNYDKNTTAKKILKNIERQEKAAVKVNLLCDNLFCSFGDSEMCNQYKIMKSKGNKYETLNLCKNYSRVLNK